MESFLWCHINLSLFEEFMERKTKEVTETEFTIAKCGKRAQSRLVCVWRIKAMWPLLLFNVLGWNEHLWCVGEPRVAVCHGMCAPRRSELRPALLHSLLWAAIFLLYWLLLLCCVTAIFSNHLQHLLTCTFSMPLGYSYSCQSYINPNAP